MDFYLALPATHIPHHWLYKLFYTSLAAIIREVCGRTSISESQVYSSVVLKEVALWQVFLRAQVFPVSIIPAVLHSHSSIADPVQSQHLISSLNDTRQNRLPGKHFRLAHRACWDCEFSLFDKLKYAVFIQNCILTPWSRVFLEKLTGPQLVLKFPPFYGTAFTKKRHLSLSSARPIQSMFLHSIPRRSILISSSHLHLDLPRGLLLSGFLTKTLYAPLPSLVRATFPSISVFLTWSSEYLVRNTDRKAPCHVVFSTPLLPRPLGPKYTPQHPILENPLPPFS